MPETDEDGFKWKCPWCKKANAEPPDWNYAPTFILDPEGFQTAIGDPELREATELRGFVHDMRAIGEGIQQCQHYPPRQQHA